MPVQPRQTPPYVESLRIAGIYLAFAALWIYASDNLLAILVDDPARLTHFQTVKGWLFVTVSAVLIYGLIYRTLGISRKIQRSLHETEIRLQLFIEHAPVALAMFDREMHYLAVSRRWLDDYGLRARDILGQSHYEVFPEIGESLITVHNRCLAGEVISVDEDRFVRADGGVQWLRWEVRPWQDQEGGVGGIVIFSEDITARKQVEDALREREVQYRNLADAGLALIWTSGPDKLCTYFNRRWLEFTGRTLEQELGNGWTEGVYADDLPRCFDVYVSSFDRRAPFEMEYRLRHATGSYRWIRDMGTPNFNSSGEFVGYIGHCFDITEQKHGEFERQALIDELKKRTSELERFTYTVSHDLKSPLVTILGFVGQLEQDLQENDADSIRSDLIFIRGAARQMGELLDNLLQLSRAGRAIAEPQPVDLAAVARQVIEQVCERPDALRIKLDIATNLPVVKGDAVRLREVFQNLIENAVKFTSGTSDPQIEISCATGVGEIICCVRDNGVGIDAQYQERIFGLFEKLDPNGAGTGIGLAIVRRIVEGHGGRVWVESAGAGRGSTFNFSLPT